MIHHIFKALSHLSKHTSKVAGHTTKTAARSGSMVVGKTVKPHERAATIVKYWNQG
jgi:hypothetical protein